MRWRGLPCRYRRCPSFRLQPLVITWERWQSTDQRILRVASLTLAGRTLVGRCRGRNWLFDQTDETSRGLPLPHASVPNTAALGHLGSLVKTRARLFVSLRKFCGGMQKILAWNAGPPPGDPRSAERNDYVHHAHAISMRVFLAIPPQNQRIHLSAKTAECRRSINNVRGSESPRDVSMV